MHVPFSRLDIELSSLLKNFLLLALLFIGAQPLNSQVRYELELLPDNETYLVSFVSDVTYNPPGNIVVSGQVTIRLPHGIAPNSFQVVDLTMETPGASWAAEDIVYSPDEAPHFDYFSFSLTTPATPVYNFQAGVPIPVFSFKNGVGFCADSLYIIDNDNDPMLPFNSLGLNIGNSIVLFGGGFSNIYGGYVGTGAAPGTPKTICNNEVTEEYVSCDTVFYNGEAYTRDTVFDVHYTSSVGCDSVLITHIVIQNEIFTTVDTVICEGDIFKGIPILQDEIVTENFITNNGCDSMVTYLVEVAQPSTYQENINIVAGSPVNGIPVFSDTIIVKNLTNVNGCDSIVTINVSVFNDQPTIIDIDICLGESHNGNFFLVDTTLTEVLVNSMGMDSTVITNIFVHKTYYINVLADLCEGQPHTDGVVYENDTSFVKSHQTIYGCDSVITTTINVVIPEYNITDTAICSGQLYNGIMYFTDQVLTQSIASMTGCDSVVNQVNLKVFPMAEATIEGVTDICEGGETLLTATGGSEFLWNNGTTANELLATAPGIYQVTVSNGTICSDVASATVSESGISFQTDVDHPQCNYSPYGTIHVTNIVGGFEPYIYSIDGGSTFSTEPIFPALQPGQYSIVVEDQYGCSTEEVAVVDALTEIWVEAGDDVQIRLGESTKLRAETNLPAPDSIIWSPAIGLDCTDCLQPEASPLATTFYTVTIFDENGCSAESQVAVQVRADKDVYVPNAFSPNGDGFNDNLTVFAGENVTQVLRFEVFDRWGGHVFFTKNFNPNDLTAGWTGHWRNQPAVEGVYLWTAEVEFLNGHRALHSGEVVLMR